VKRKLSEALGIIDPLEGVARRATFIVDPHNIIRFVRDHPGTGRRRGDYRTGALSALRGQKRAYSAIIEEKAAEVSDNSAALAGLAERGDDRAFFGALGESILRRSQEAPELGRLLLLVPWSVINCPTCSSSACSRTSTKWSPDTFAGACGRPRFASSIQRWRLAA
jgi:hypothetical protein